VSATKRRSSGAWPLRTLSAVLVLAAAVLPAVARGESALRPARRVQQARAQEHARLLSLAAEHFRAGRYAAARELFDALLASDARQPERASIAFNAAVSSYALAEYADALARFQAIERAYPQLAALAGINAGFAALHAGDLQLAGRYANGAEPLSDELTVRREKLRAELEQALESERVRAREQQLRAGFADIAAERWQPAREQLTAALANMPPSDREGLADAHYGLGLVALQLGEGQPALHHFEHSLQQRPRDARTLLALAQAAEQSAQPRRAESAYETALQLPLPESEQRDAERALSLLYPLPSGGVSGYVALGAGVDGNATQSGSGDLLAAGASEAQSSPYASGMLELGGALRTSRRSSLGLSYTGDVLALLRPGVDDLSLQAHELVARGQWAPQPGMRWRLDAGGAHVLAGLSPLRSFEWDALLALTLDLETGARSRARLQLGERLVRATELSYLDGHRLHLLGTQLWSLGAWELSLHGALRLVSAGTERVALASDAFATCSPSCDQRSYHNPYGYWSPGVGAGVAWQALERLRLTALGRAEYRGYLEQSRITGIPESRKTRQDVRLRGQLGAELSLDQAGRFRVTLDQTLLASLSNMAWATDDQRHQYDYGDRNFLQPTTELGVSASFP
jgi:tetratricopeptide (TPR) repeat protein